MILVWRGTDAFRAEVAHVDPDGARLRAHGTQIGVEPQPYELRYTLVPERLRVEVEGGGSLDLELGERDAFDLEFSPLFNSIPVLRNGLHRGGAARDYVMAWVSVPDLRISRSEQRYEPLEPGRVRYRSDGFSADVDFDDAGFVVRYPGLAERIA